MRSKEGAHDGVPSKVMRTARRYDRAGRATYESAHLLPWARAEGKDALCIRTLVGVRGEQIVEAFMAGLVEKPFDICAAVPRPVGPRGSTRACMCMLHMRGSRVRGGGGSRPP